LFAGIWDKINIYSDNVGSGVQSSDNYRAVQEKWMKKTDDAFRKIMTPDQFLRYEKLTGQYAKRIKEEKDKAKEKAKLDKEMQKNKEK